MAIFNKTIEILATETVQISRKFLFDCNKEAISSTVRYTIKLQCQNIIPPRNTTVTLNTVFREHTPPKMPYCRVLFTEPLYEYVIENLPVYVTEIQVRNSTVTMECYYEYTEAINV